MLATVATGVTRVSNLTYGHKPQGHIQSLSDPLGVLVFAALRPYGPYAQASRAACASPNQVNASPCSGPSSGPSSFEAARAQARAGDAKIGPASWRADSGLIDQLSETCSQPEDDSEQSITRLIIRIFPRRKAGQLAAVKTSAMELSHKNVAILFHLPLHKAASKLGISPTTLKRACRKIGIFKWPFRLLEHQKMEVAADAREAARKLRLLNPRPTIPATDPATLNSSRNSTPHSSLAADVCIPDHHPYRITNQPGMEWRDAMSCDITETVRLLTEENRRLQSLARQQEEHTRFLHVLAWPATAPVGTRHNEQSDGSIFKSGRFAPPSRGCISNLLNP
jgi:hypothetical protein